jgi:tetratricopeptide (TPR) repeat protein
VGSGVFLPQTNLVTTVVLAASARRATALIGALLWALLLPGSAFAQTSANVTIDSNEQLFCMMAALNAAGDDIGLFVNTGDTTRQEVRSLLVKENIPSIAQLSKFYEAHRVQGNNESQYISLALLLGPPPQFAFTIPATDLPPDAGVVAGIVPLLREFYRQADIKDLYLRMRPQYTAAIEKYVPEVRREIALTDGYLRFPSGSYLGRYYRIYLCLLGAPEQVQAGNYRENYYLVITPSARPRFSDIRYLYLHFLLDPLAVKFGADIHDKSSLETIARQAPALKPDFKYDFSLFVTECLVRAAELRMDRARDAQKALNSYLTSGLILAPYFYSALADYEKQSAPMSVYYQEMIRGIDVDKLEDQLASVRFSPAPAPPKASVPALSAKDQLLNQGDNLIYLGKYDQARQAFQEVLKQYDPKSVRALYGLAVAASNTAEPDIAEEYFKRTLAVARNVRIVTWSHIYLGRIYDLEGKRQEALQQYHAALVTAASFPEAMQALQIGLRHPFQGGP